MKRTTICFLTALLLISCSKQVHIEGNIDPALDRNGKTVTISRTIGDSTITIATGSVIGNRFDLKADAQQPYMAILDIEDTDRFPVCIEEGTVHISLTAPADSTESIRLSCKGTPNNDLLNNYNELTDAFWTNLFTLGQDSAEASRAEADFIAAIYNLAYQNAQTIAGKEIFLDSHYTYSTEQKMAFFNLLDKDAFLIPKMKRIYEATLNEANAATGNAYIDITATTPDGKTLALSDMVGKTDFVLIDFWASWCGPCRRSMPELRAFYDRHKDQVEILGVSLDTDHTAWTNAINKLGLTWQHISNLDGWQSAQAKAYGVSSIPTTILINRQGTIVGRRMSLQEMEQLIADKE